MYEVIVEIPVDKPISFTTILGTDVFKLQDKIERAIGKKCYASGCGHGYRDFEMLYENREKAEASAKKAIEILEKEGFKVNRQGSKDSAFVTIREL